MGTPEFSIPTLNKLIKNKFNILNIYTQPPKKSKRGLKVNPSPIENFSKKNKLNFRNPENLDTPEEYNIFKKLNADLAIVVAYGKLIPKNFLNLTKFGFINIHASLLPKWRGAAPIQRAIINEDKKTGVSIMKIVEELDAGPVLAFKELALDKNSTHGEIEKILSLIGADLLIENLKHIESGKAKFYDQEHSQATYAKKIIKDESKINWNLSANKVIAHIHGLSPNPGAWFKYKEERYKVLKAIKTSQNNKPGVVISEKLMVACKSESIQILEIQREGKNKQTVNDFLLGKKIDKGSILS